MLGPVNIMALVAAVLWIVIACRFLPAIWRGYGRSAKDNDQLRGFLFFVAVLQIAFIVRRLAAPYNNSSLAGLYALSIMCAFVGVMMLRGYTRDS